MAVDFKEEYARAARTGVWHVVRRGEITLCGRKLTFDLTRSWPGFNTKRCPKCIARRRERA